MQAEFRETMPCCKFEEEPSDDAVVVFGEQALENWYCALPEPASI